MAGLSCQVEWGLSEYRGSVSAVVAQLDGHTFLVRGGSRAVVNKVKLFAEVVKGETHNIEESLHERTPPASHQEPECHSPQPCP